ncbi:uncharacterized protein LOC122716038 [Apis laboriosa]|uniref:uncharacterized protein LOC122716038 n=1 Tax=Apis laboriosa TaxID=183418 RepID=UPI001CC7B2BA|nr:uncharacterized protein LOC122716038 [Apis laboriosa]
MADEDKKNDKNQIEELYAWISTIPLSKPTKNLSRDLSDAVIIAEILKIYYPRYVDLHNYVPANSITMKKENWKILNRKVLSKIHMKLNKNIINQLANCHPGTAEYVLLELKKKVLKDFENLSFKENDFIEEATISNKSLPNVVDQLTLECIDRKTSIFYQIKEKSYFILKWFINWLCFWNYFQNIMFRLKNPFQSSLKEDAETQRTSEDINGEDGVPRHVCVQLRQKLQEIDDIIYTLNHKVAYLESTMKLKDMRISNLTSQILLHNEESKSQFTRVEMNDTSSKIRMQNIEEKVKIEK